MQEDPAARRCTIESALLDYHRSPGQYALTDSQPPLLFASVTEVLQLASGRTPEGQEQDLPSESVRAAAAFFIRSALLRPGADHYALLGLDRGADSGAIKDRYRLMMRLMHPDFSGGPAGEDWPEDAASRVNQAYEVLSSAHQRRAYDERLAAPHPQHAPEPQLRRFRPAAPQSTNANDRLRLKRLATVFGAAGAVVLLATLYAGAGEKESLIQRAATRSGAVVAALVQATAAPSTAPPASAAGDASASLEFAVRQAAAQAASAPAFSRPPAKPITKAAETPTPEAAPAQANAPAAPSQAASDASSAVVSAPPPPATPMASAPALAPAPAVALATASSASPVASPPPAAAKATLKPGVTLAQVHPLLSKLLQQIESGWGDLVLSQLDREARADPGAQALLQRYNAIVEGARPVKLSGVQFKGEPRDGLLVVTGQVVLHPANQTQDAPGKPFAIQAEFALREGAVVMTRLAPARED